MTEHTGTRDIYVRANGLRHHLIGRGHPGTRIVVMIHGLTQQAHVFDHVGTILSDANHVYCLDVRGRGETEWGDPAAYHLDTYVADLEAVREALGLDRIALVGTSMGGMISMQYAARYPGRVSRVVLNDIGPEVDPAGAARIREMTATAPQAFTDLNAVAKYYRESNAQMLMGRSNEAVLDYARWHVRRSDTGVWVWKMDPAVRNPPSAPPPPALSPWEAYKKVDCPVLIVRGAESDILSEEIAARMCEAKPDAALVRVPGIGHAPGLAEPEALPALQAFLAG